MGGTREDVLLLDQRASGKGVCRLERTFPRGLPAQNARVCYDGQTLSTDLHSIRQRSRPRWAVLEGIDSSSCGVKMLST